MLTENMLWAWNVVFVCNTESIFLCVSTSEAEPPPPATHYHFNHWFRAHSPLHFPLCDLPLCAPPYFAMPSQRSAPAHSIFIRSDFRATPLTLEAHGRSWVGLLVPESTWTEHAGARKRLRKLVTPLRHVVFVVEVLLIIFTFRR